jgi:hypothetical protein
MTDNENPFDKLAIIPPHKWPQSATPDDRLYSLETGPRTELEWDEETREIVERDLTLPNPATGFSGFDRPDYPRQTGTYTEIQKEASRLNKAQDLSGQILYMFFPHPVQKLAA